MGYPKFRILPGGHDLATSTSTVFKMKKGRMFGGGMLGSVGTDTGEVHVHDSVNEDGPWREIYCAHAQYSGIMWLAPFPCDRYIQVVVTGTGATFDAYECWE